MNHTPLENKDTAFVTCWYRSTDEELSGDPYARHWVTPEAKRWADLFLEVSEHEPQTHCLRNRFFLDRIARFTSDNPNGTLVNIGAGYSLYPYLLPEGPRFCDVDMEQVLAAKSKDLANWEADGMVPPRSIHYLPAELESASGRARLEEQLSEWMADAPSFFLIEGVLFFLSESTIRAVFEMFFRLQKPGDQLGTVSFLPEIRETLIYQRLQQMMKKRFHRLDTQKNELPTRFYEELQGYRLLTHSDYCTFSQQIIPERAFTNPEAILNEHLYLLERT